MSESIGPTVAFFEISVRIAISFSSDNENSIAPGFAKRAGIITLEACGGAGVAHA